MLPFAASHAVPGIRTRHDSASCSSPEGLLADAGRHGTAAVLRAVPAWLLGSTALCEAQAPGECTWFPHPARSQGTSMRRFGCEPRCVIRRHVKSPWILLSATGHAHGRPGGRRHSAQLHGQSEAGPPELHDVSTRGPNNTALRCLCAAEATVTEGRWVPREAALPMRLPVPSHTGITEGEPGVDLHPTGCAQMEWQPQLHNDSRSQFLARQRAVSQAWQPSQHGLLVAARVRQRPMNALSARAVLLTGVSQHGLPLQVCGEGEGL